MTRVNITLLVDPHTSDVTPIFVFADGVTPSDAEIHDVYVVADRFMDGLQEHKAIILPPGYSISVERGHIIEGRLGHESEKSF